MSESADELADLAESLNDAEQLTANPNCPSFAQVLWQCWERQQPALEAAARFTGFDGIELSEPQ
jgi:hypothetical protein